MRRITAALRAHSPRSATASPWRIGLESLGVLVVCWALYLPYFSQPTFLDEFDNMIGGNVVAHGGTIYIDYLSQHTPVAYWISALGHLLGAEYFSGQRLFGFGVFATLLALFYVRNVRLFGRLPLLIVVTLVPMMHFYNPELSYTILSDNYQAIMCLVLLFEVVAIGAFGKSPISRWLVIGLASAFAVGVAFVSIYYVMAALATALTLTVLQARHELKGVGPWARYAGARAAAYAAPFLAIGIVLVWTGSLAPAFQQAYVLNRTYYSQYIAAGLGSDAIAPLYTGLVDLGWHLINLPATFADNAVSGVREFVGILTLAAIVAVLWRVHPLLALGVLWMASLTATRGWNGFHAQPLWVFLLGCLGLLVWIVKATWNSTVPWLRLTWTVAVGTAVALAVVPYAQHVYSNRATLAAGVSFPNPNRSALIEALVPSGRSYGELGINNAYDFVVTRRLPAGGFAGVVPWFSDMMDAEMADALRDDDPILIFSDESNDVWGFNVLDNAPELAAVIEDGYTRIDVSAIGITEGVYIRNDAIDQALATLRETFQTADISIAR